MNTSTAADLKLSWAPIPQLPWDVGIDLTAALGFSAFDLLMVGDLQAVRISEVRADLPAWAERIGQRLQDRGLAIADVFGIPDGDLGVQSPNHPEPAERELSRGFFEDMLELTVRLGCSGMSMMPGLEWPGEIRQESWDRAVQELGWRVERAHERGKRFGIEPHNGSLLRTPEEAAELCAQTPGLQICLDYSHHTSLGSTDAEIEVLLPHTRHVHVRGAANRWLQAPLRDSTIDWERAVDAMYEHGYRGYVALEYISGELDDRMREVDVMAETILLRDRLSAKLDGRPWADPLGPGSSETAASSAAVPG